MAVNLTSGALSKIMTGKCTENDMKPVLQVIYINSSRVHTMHNKQWYWVGLSDGSFFQIGGIAEEIFISNKLQKGSILQLTKFQLTMFQLAKPFTTSKGEILSKRGFLCFDLTVIHTKCGIIGDPNLLLDDETPLDEDRANSHHVEESPTSKQKQDHVDSLLNEDIDDVEEPPTSTQKCSSRSPTQNKKRKLQSSDDDISGFGKDISDVMKMTLEKTIEDGLGPCYKKLATLEEGVSKMTRIMMEKNKQFVVGFKKLERLEEYVSKMAKTMMDKNKQDDVGACFKKLEILEEDVSKLTRMMMEKSKEDDMGACIEKLDKIGWAAQDPMYDIALLLFGQSADYRKLWLHLKPESCGNWVKSAGSMFGLLD
ncbi:L10-interacting MYB domain-containing protein-like protein [Tanacetum coccineum]